MWASNHEVHLTSEQSGWLESLRTADAEFDREQSLSAAPHQSEFARLAQGLKRRFLRIPLGIVQSLGAPTRLFSRFLKRTARLALQRPVPPRIAVGNAVATIIDLSKDDFAGEIERVETPLLILVRSGKRVSRREITAFAKSMATTPSATFWYCDSIAPNGLRIYRPGPSHLLSEQVDWLGAIVGVKTDSAREAVTKRPTFVSFVQQIALCVPESATARLDLCAGIAAFSESTSEYPSTPRLPISEPLVSIIIPTRGTIGDVSGVERVFVSEAVRSIVNGTSYNNYELIVVADDSTPQKVIDELSEIAGERLALVRWSAPFNFSEKMNLGAAVATGALLLMLNDDVEVASPNWLAEMVALLERREFAAAGALLFFEDLTFQHAGHLYRGGAGHVGFGRSLTPRNLNTYLHFDREVSGVTGACLLVSKSDFASVGGFSAQFPGNYNDVDFCLKLRSRGGRIVCSGGARLYHFESKSRDATVRPHDVQRIHARWRRELSTDSFWTGPH